ncbi:MAG TPA: ComEC/Rec2 family competence protein [Candidatus Eremiobacteraceae bacterium]|nr:ComEC/Rec2 family competence protein [Candidatus Eremiobacteraceae bacterium]
MGPWLCFCFGWHGSWRYPKRRKPFFVLVGLLAYVAVVEQRAPVLRAALMAALVIVGGYFHRRLDLLNSAALAALVLLLANPKYAIDAGFQLSFLAIGAIAGLALPLIQRTVQPFLSAVDDWSDVTRDARHSAALVQFRLDLRDALRALTSPLKERHARWAQSSPPGESIPGCASGSCWCFRSCCSLGCCR